MLPRIFFKFLFTKISSLARVDQELVDFVRGIRDGEKSHLQIGAFRKSIFLSALACHVKFDGKELKLVALHDVSSELAAKEAETWQKLLRVLTHEISNSAIPLSTLSSFTTICW
ncbi:MAG: hypothetical protein IPJ20_03260 [Flammeovirgaceae bacterium]|nr:hypothetical protein [Flammeovirgaceae bacterium]